MITWWSRHVLRVLSLFLCLRVDSNLISSDKEIIWIKTSNKIICWNIVSFQDRYKLITKYLSGCWTVAYWKSFLFRTFHLQLFSVNEVVKFPATRVQLTYRLKSNTVIIGGPATFLVVGSIAIESLRRILHPLKVIRSWRTKHLEWKRKTIEHGSILREIFF